MRPCAARKNVADIRAGDAVKVRNLVGGQPAAAFFYNPQHVSVFEFGNSHSLSACGSSVSETVVGIVLGCAPCKIVNVVIQAIAVEVSCLVLFIWSWWSKRFKDEAVHFSSLWATILVQRYGSSSGGARASLQGASRRNSGSTFFAANPAEVRNRIKTLVSPYLLPAFNAMILLRHAWSSSDHVCLEPGSVLQHRPGSLHYSTFLGGTNGIS